MKHAATWRCNGNPTAAAGNSKGHRGGNHGQFSLSVPDVVNIQDWPLAKRHGDCGLICVSRIRNCVAAAGAQPLAAYLSCGCVRNGRKVTSPDQPRCNAVLSVKDRY